MEPVKKQSACVLIRGRESVSPGCQHWDVPRAQVIMWIGSEFAGGDGGDERHRARLAMLQRVVVELHCCSAEHLETVHVKETFMDRAIWEGDVEVFTLIDNPRARRCYAWIKGIRGRKRARFFAVLETRVVRSALDAVKFAHLANNAQLIDEFSRLGDHEQRLPPPF